MKKITQIVLIAFLILGAGACGNSKKDSNSIITEKKTKLAKLRDEKNKQEAEIKKLEEELALIDTTSGNSAKIKLVAVSPVGQQDFQHFIDLQGKIDAENISYISPRGMGGQVRA